MMTMIVAVDRNYAIGRGNDLPWRLRRDMKHFREQTKGGVVIMGRKTAESLSGALVGRLNLVLTSNKDWSKPGFLPVYSPEALLDALKGFEGIERFVIGGAEIYKLLLPFVDKLMITYVDAEIPDADTYLPVGFDFNWENFRFLFFQCADDENEYNFDCCILKREVDYELAYRSLWRSQNRQNHPG